MRALSVLVCGLALAGGSAAANAQHAKRTPPAADAPMQVHLVRSAQAGCEPQCPEWIAAQGKIDSAALKQFKKVLTQLGQRKLPILVDSAGGSVNDAFAIGRLVRAKGLDVVVTRTLLLPCSPTDDACRKSKRSGVLLGMPQAHLSKCASSCAFILAGGTRRSVGPSTFVGVHQISYFRIMRTYRVLTRRTWSETVIVRKTLLSERIIPQRAVPEGTYVDIKRYFADMGIGEGIMPLITSTPRDKIHWLTQHELRSTGLATDWTDGEQLLAGAAPPSVGAVGTTPALQAMGSQAFCEKFAGLVVGCPSNLTPDDPDHSAPAVVHPNPAPVVPPQ